MSIFEPIITKARSKEERKLTLSSLIFLKQKINEDIKVISCVDGQPQRQTMKKEDATSPTVATECVFVTSAIDAFKRRKVENLDIASDFLYNPMDPKDPKVHMALQEKLTEIMVNSDPKLYSKIVSTYSKGRMILYVEMQKALYVMPKYALLFYIKLVRDLTRACFKLNLYDPCVMKKPLEGEQITVVFDVYDMKVYHTRLSQR